jgi:hypothetical protein
MIKYQPYSIFIDGNVRNLTGKREGATFEPLVYEARIRVTLNAIGASQIGKMLFRSLNPRVPVLISPYLEDKCNAQTGQRSSDPFQTGQSTIDPTKGIGIRYSPETWAFDRCGRLPGYRPVESLFHEMVHASRFTNFGYEKMTFDPLKGMQDYEEFLAVMVSNMYRAEIGARKFNRDYLTGTLVSQAELEKFLASTREYLDGLEYFSWSSDPLIKLISTLPVSFNPFRDLKRLEMLRS